MSVILAIDQGTTGTTVLAIDAGGHVVGRAYQEIEQYYPHPGWVEHDPEELWQSVRECAGRALSAAGAAGDGVAGIGITNQRETVVVWDRESGEPIHPAIVWQDRRTTPQCQTLKESGHEAFIRERSGLVIDPYFSGTKIAWLLEQGSETRRRAEAGDLAAGTIDCWLIWKLTGGRVHATDHTNASRTQLYRIDQLGWDSELGELLGVPLGMLPRVLPSGGVFALSDGDAIGFESPIAGVMGDQQAALYGQGAWEAGLAKCTYGTGAFLLLHTGEEVVKSERGLLTTVACGPRGEPAYALEGSVFIAGAAVQWLRDELRIVKSAAETEELARSLDSNDGVYFVPAFVGLGAPHWLAEARGTLVGLTRGSSRAHLVRASLEAMAYSVHDLIQAMLADWGGDVRELRVDGGAARNDWLMQFQSDVAGLPIGRPELVETTAFGAAALAGLSTGFWADPDEVRALQKLERRFEPAMPKEERQSLLGGWRRAIESAAAWARFAEGPEQLGR